jgi:hypothetical protein
MGRLSNRAFAYSIMLLFVLTIGSFFFSSHSDLLFDAFSHGARAEAPTP